jgi:hypothetical protein
MPLHEPSHSGPPLREEFIIQERLSDFTAAVSGDFNPLFMIVDPDNPSEPGVTAAEQWLTMLDGETSLDEVFYLMGVEDASERQERATQLLDHATNHNIDIRRGQTLNDLQESGAWNVYGQLAPMFVRPTRTPDGQPFPHTSIEDAETRTARLRDVRQKLSLNPAVVVNMGSGFDVTPSDAFPSARVVHVDIVPDIVAFLQQSGFEAYQPDQVPEDLAADLIIDVFGPGQGIVPLAPGGSLLTTQNHIPEGMTTTCIIPSTRFEILPAVTDPAAMREITKGHADVRIRVLTEE